MKSMQCNTSILAAFTATVLAAALCISEAMACTSSLSNCTQDGNDWTCKCTITGGIETWIGCPVGAAQVGTTAYQGSCSQQCSAMCVAETTGGTPPVAVVPPPETNPSTPTAAGTLDCSSHLSGCTQNGNEWTCACSVTYETAQNQSTTNTSQVTCTVAAAQAGTSNYQGSCSQQCSQNCAAALGH